MKWQLHNMELIIEILNIGHINEMANVLIVGTKKEYQDAVSKLCYESYPVWGNTLYVAASEENWMASFMSHNPKDETGFCGATFTLQMNDGSTRCVKGPWSSRADVVNRILEDRGIKIDIMEATFMCNGSRTAIAINVPVLEKMFPRLRSQLRAVIDRHSK